MIPASTETLYPRFSAAEFGRRHAGARTVMAQEGLDVLVVYGDSSLYRHNQADVHYLSGFLGNRNTYVAMTRTDEPVLFAQTHNHVPNAREMSSIETRWGGPDSAVTVAAWVRDVVLRPGVLGYVGDVPARTYTLSLHDALPILVSAARINPTCTAWSNVGLTAAVIVPMRTSVSNPASTRSLRRPSFTGQMPRLVSSS